MKIIVASDGLDVAQSFATCPNFSFYSTCGYEIAGVQNIPAQGASAPEYADFMASIGVDALIVGAIAPAARQAFEAYDIDVIQDMAGNATDAAAAYVAQKASELDDECITGDEDD